MVLGGFQKSSLIDYPGKISCILFLSGCNFVCPYCHNPGLARGDQKIPSYLNEDWIYAFLNKRKGLLDGVVITGGEPTLQKDIFRLCENIKQIGYPIKLDTNGSRPEVVKALVDKGIVDYIAMDIKTDPGGYAPLICKDSDPDTLRASIRVIMESGLDYEFRTTCIKPIVDTDILQGIMKEIKGARLYVLQRFHHTDVLNSEFIEEHAWSMSDDELAHMKSVADGWVRSCIVR